jgi:hypothetical protein
MAERNNGWSRPASLPPPNRERARVRERDRERKRKRKRETERERESEREQRRHGVEPRLSAPAQPQMCDTGRRMHPNGSLLPPVPSSPSPPALKSLTAQIEGGREKESGRQREREGRERQATHPEGQRRQRGSAWVAGRRRPRGRSAAGSVLRKDRYERSLFNDGCSDRLEASWV